MPSAFLTPPPLSGLTWRAVTLADLPALVNLANECDTLDGGLCFVNEPQSLTERVFPKPTLDASLGAFTSDEQLAAVTTINLMGDDQETRAVIIGQVKPAYRHKGLGKYLLHWSEAQAQTLFSTQPAANKVLRIATESLTPFAHNLYLAHGFTCFYESLVMQRKLQTALPNCPFPANVTLANWSIDRAPEFFRAYHAAFRDRPGFPNPSAEEWITDYLENENLQAAWSLVANVGATPAGFVCSSHEPTGGYIVQIGVVTAYRQQGLAAALMIESLKRMQAAGIVQSQLEVNVNNPRALKVYEQLGFVTTGRRAKYERPLHLV